VKKVNLVLLLSLAGGVASTSSYAGEWSIGVNGGQSSYDVDESSCFGVCEIDDSDSSVGVNVTYHFSDNWGVELGYLDFGAAGVSGRLDLGMSDINFDADVEATAPYLVATGTFYLSDQFSITGRAGVGSLDIEASVLAGNVSESSEEVLLGASLDYHFTDSFSAGLRYDTIDDVSAAALQLKYYFGK